MNCPWCKDEGLLVVINHRKPWEEDDRECQSCGCLFNTRHPSEIAGFQYDDPRLPEGQEAAP